MIQEEIEIKIKTATELEIRDHLLHCDSCYIPPLSTRVNITEYSNKLSVLAMTFEAWHHANLIGLVAAYFNDETLSTAYISDVSVNSIYQGKGVARKLVLACINYAHERKFRYVNLEVGIENAGAIQLYTTLGFSKVTEKEHSTIMSLKISN